MPGCVAFVLVLLSQAMGAVAMEMAKDMDDANDINNTLKKMMGQILLAPVSDANSWGLAEPCGRNKQPCDMSAGMYCTSEMTGSKICRPCSDHCGKTHDGYGEDCREKCPVFLYQERKLDEVENLSISPESLGLGKPPEKDSSEGLDHGHLLLVGLSIVLIFCLIAIAYLLWDKYRRRGGQAPPDVEMRSIRQSSGSGSHESDTLFDSNRDSGIDQITDGQRTPAEQPQSQNLSTTLSSCTDSLNLQSVGTQYGQQPESVQILSSPVQASEH